MALGTFPVARSFTAVGLTAREPQARRTSAHNERRHLRDGGAWPATGSDQNWSPSADQER
jgi:hypothetical protein